MNRQEAVEVNRRLDAADANIERAADRILEQSALIAEQAERIVALERLVKALVDRKEASRGKPV